MAGQVLAQNLPSHPAFRTRALVAGSEAASEPTWKKLDSLPSFRTEFSQIQVDKSLLINVCGPWCAEAPFQLEETFKTAAAARSVTGVDLMSNWKGRLSQRPAAFGLRNDFTIFWPGTPPFHLLAIVNRLDLAKWDRAARRWNGAETRFVYGESQGKEFTVIVEFQYRPLTWSEFKDLAAVWRELSSCQSAGDCLKTRLDRLHATRRTAPGWFDLVKLRTNSNLHQQWHLLHWTLEEDGWQQGYLEYELDPACYAQSQARCDQLFAIWDQLEREQGVRAYTVPRALLLDEKAYGAQIAMPYILDRRSPAARNLLALQQCSHCHLEETKTRFTHIANRKPDECVAALSPFLTGTNPNAGLDDLRSQRQTHEVVVEPARHCSGTPCPPLPKITRYFHDLGRRRLFLAAVLAASAQENETQADAIGQFGTDFSH